MSLSIVEETGLTDVGRHRHGNEDNYFMVAPLYAVADGMGGAQAGEVASRIAVEAFETAAGTSAEPEARLAEIARAANRRIHELAREDQSRAGMGTTLSAVMVGEGEVSIGHVGDSRVYRFRDDGLERLTTDHSYVQELVSQGRLTPEEAEVHPQSSIITRALGPEPDVDVDTFTIESRDGDVYLICSDGLTGMVPERDISAILRRAASLEAAAGELIRSANDNGGRDNITVVLFRLGVPGPGDEDTLTGLEGDLEAVSAAAAAAVDPETPPAGSRLASDETSVDPAGEGTRMGTRPGLASTPRREASAARATAPAEVKRPIRPRRRRARSVVRALVTLAAIAAVAAAAYALAHRVFFIGTDKGGLLTVNQGLPYAPLGAELYRPRYTSRLSAASLAPIRRAAVLGRWRSRADAFDLIRSLEESAQPEPTRRRSRRR